MTGPGKWLRVRWRRLQSDRDRGMQTVELVILTPVVILLLLVVVGLGRYSYGKQLVSQAAFAAARAASLTTTATDASAAAQAAGGAALAGAGISCRDIVVTTDVTDFRAGGTVRVTVSCTASLSDLALSGLPGSTTVTAAAAAPLETYRQLDATPSGPAGAADGH